LDQWEEFLREAALLLSEARASIVAELKSFKHYETDATT
jgi:hypothetical protein